MFTDYYIDVESKMENTLENLTKVYGSIRTGKANPAILNDLSVDYYGAATPVAQLASISSPEPRLLVIKPYDKTIVPTLEKEILKSDLGLTPNITGDLIRLNIPALSEEKRKDLVKTLKKKTEELKVAIRNVRRDSNDILKKMKNDDKLPEDEVKKAQDETQKITDKFIGKIDEAYKVKEQEILND